MSKYLFKKLSLFLILFISFSCSSEISVVVKNALDAYSEGKYLTSLFFSEQALLENPKDEDALLIAVKAHLKLEEYDQADRKLDNLFSLSDDPELLFIKSQINIGKQDYQTALLYLEKYLAINNKIKNEFAFFNAAFCYYQLGEFDSALKYYQQYSSFNPLNKEVYLNIANLFGYIGKPDSALAYYNKVLSLDSTNYNALYNRSVEYQIQNKDELAIKDLEKLVNFYPNDVNVIMDLAKVKIKSKKYFGAINDLSKAIQIDSSNAEAYYLRGKSFIELSKTFSACVDFNKAGNLGHFDAYEMIKKYCTPKRGK